VTVCHQLTWQMVKCWLASSIDRWWSVGWLAHVADGEVLVGYRRWQQSLSCHSHCSLSHIHFLDLCCQTFVSVTFQVSFVSCGCCCNNRNVCIARQAWSEFTRPRPRPVLLVWDRSYNDTTCTSDHMTGLRYMYRLAAWWTRRLDKM